MAGADAGVEEMVHEVVGSQERAGKFAREAWATAATPSVKAAGFAADFGQLGGK